MQHDQLAKQIRQNLLNQKERLLEYLSILEKQDNGDLKKDADALIRFIDSEKKIVTELNQFKKILEPLEKMYVHATGLTNHPLKPLIDSIEKLTDQADKKMLENESIIAEKAGELKLDPSKILKERVRFNPGSLSGVPSGMVDVSG